MVGVGELVKNRALGDGMRAREVGVVALKCEGVARNVDDGVKLGDKV